VSCYGQRCLTREDADERYAEEQEKVDLTDEFSKLPVIEQLYRMDGMLNDPEPERLNTDLPCPTCQNPRCPSLRWIPELDRYGRCPNVDYGCKAA
jgi:hypothetical protein